MEGGNAKRLSGTIVAIAMDGGNADDCLEQSWPAAAAPSVLAK
jgi:hypothetical protein